MRLREKSGRFVKKTISETSIQQSKIIAEFLLDRKHYLNLMEIERQAKLKRGTIWRLLNYYNPDFKNKTSKNSIQAILHDEFLRLVDILTCLQFELPIFESKITMIRDKICEFSEIPLDILISHTRKRPIVETRQIGMFLCCKYTKRQEVSLSEIGELFGGFDHATVFHANKTIENLLQTNAHIRTKVRAYDKKIRFFITL